MKYNYQSEALEKLLPVGFKKQREFFFLIKEPNLMVLYRKFTPAGADEYYLAFTHTFFQKVLNKSGKYIIPTLLEYYPVSIAVSQLRLQFTKHPSIHDFDCELHYLKREMFPSEPSTAKPSLFSWANLMRLLGKKKSGTFINPVDVALQEGLKFMEQFSLEFSRQVLIKNRSLQSLIVDEQLAECNDYLAKHT